MQLPQKSLGRLMRQVKAEGDNIDVSDPSTKESQVLNSNQVAVRVSTAKRPQTNMAAALLAAANQYKEAKNA